MSRRSTSPVLALPPPRAPGPAYRWLGDALREEILAARLRPGARLPATRELAREYGLSRGTIVAAFDMLKAEGYVTGTVGSGTYVTRALPDDLLNVPRKNLARGVRSAPRVRRLSLFARAAEVIPPFEQKRTRAFRPNLPALDLFPTALWAQLSARRARGATARLLMGCGPLGYKPLQESVADYVRTSRGVKCVAEQVAIVGGVQEALSLVTRVLVDPGDRVCVEDPGYLSASLVPQSLGARVVAMPVDHEGMRVPSPRMADIRVAYVTPAHQFPLGVSMGLSRRLELLEWARATGATIFEDDYDSEFRYAGRPLPSLQGLDRHGTVVFSGSFSKVLFPSLRLGYLVLPPDLVDVVATAKSLSTGHAPLLEQAVLSEFMAEGHFGRHVRKMREVYAERRGMLLDGAAQHLSGLLEISGVEAGLQTAGWLRAGIEGEAAAAAALRDVEVVSLGRFSRTKRDREGLQLGFAAVDTREIRRGVRELAIALESLA